MSDVIQVLLGKNNLRIITFLNKKERYLIRQDNTIYNFFNKIMLSSIEQDNSKWYSFHLKTHSCVFTLF